MRKLCIREPRELSRKLAVASLALLLLQQGEGQVWVQHNDISFATHPSPSPPTPGAVLEADGLLPGLQTICI